MEFGIINLFGAVIVAVMLIPNVFYMFRFSGGENKCNILWLNIVEQVGRYASMLLMFIPLGVWKFGFKSVELMLIYIIGNCALLIAYLVIWVFYFRKQTACTAVILAVLPAAIFLISGITLGHILLIISACIFAVGHICVTYRNIRTPR